MLKVGLTGGYATGKSFVAGELQRLGCLVIYADRLGHSVLLPGGPAYQPTVDAFGTDILLPDGAIDRKRLAQNVFGSPELLQRLNSFVHPAVFKLEQEMMDDWQAQHPKGIAVVEAAILVETGRYTHFDRLILTTCNVETQIARGMGRDCLSREEVLARLARQMPLEEKKRHAHYVIDTSGAKQKTLRQVRSVFNELKELAENPVR